MSLTLGSSALTSTRFLWVQSLPFFSSFTSSSPSHSTQPTLHQDHKQVQYSNQDHFNYSHYNTEPILITKALPRSIKTRSEILLYPLTVQVSISTLSLSSRNLIPQSNQCLCPSCDPTLPPPPLFVLLWLSSRHNSTVSTTLRFITIEQTRHMHESMTRGEVVTIEIYQGAQSNPLSNGAWSPSSTVHSSTGPKLIGTAVPLNLTTYSTYLCHPRFHI